MAYTPDNMLSHRITSMCQMGDKANILAVGDTIGDIHLLDICKLSAGCYISSARKSNKSGGEDIGLGRLDNNWSITGTLMIPAQLESQQKRHEASSIRKTMGQSMAITLSLPSVSTFAKPRTKNALELISSALGSKLNTLEVNST